MTRVLLALSVLATAFSTCGSGSPRAAFPSGLGLSALSESQQLEAHRRLQEEGQVKEFRGKILKSGGKFVLEESSNGGDDAPPPLGEKDPTKKNEGQKNRWARQLALDPNTHHI